ncbi:hypothetical protein [Streptococcus caballi]|uniref:hypothetical protein n=1 Tax=Streptococcus caballi TaxID=439220 RepID=UPI00196A1225|nr:hypothetical protein [Streptococcus caballi]
MLNCLLVLLRYYLLGANMGKLPLISFALAESFDFYGLINKNIGLSSDVSMLVEAAVISPFSVIYLIFFSKESMLDYSLLEYMLLMISGLATAIPLPLFTEIARFSLYLVSHSSYYP